MNKEQNNILITKSNFRKKSILAFSVFIIFIIAAVFAWKKINLAPDVAGTPKPLRAVLDRNEKVFSSFFNDQRLAKTYPVSQAVKKVRVNGMLGLKSNLDSAWRLHVVLHPGDTISLTLDDIKKLPKTELVYDFKCIEGWSQITHWSGVKFSDFLKKYDPDASNEKYAGLVTPDKDYYVGIDMASMMHPQTLLCYEMNGKPLPLNQGYPLRLIIPVKYGIKHLKRIGTLYFSNERPPDYWYERGYDYYSGL